jgi:hypothetical protein
MDMSQDSYGSYVADMNDPMIGQTPSDKSGSGSPEGVISARPGQTYVDVDTGDFYVKQSGGIGSTGWTLVTGGGGGGGHVFLYHGTGDPNGVVTASVPASYYTDAGDWWNKTGAGSTNTGWVQIIAAP